MASQPSPPNPYQTAGAQNQQNALASQSSTISGNANASNPYGSVSYDQGTLSPIYDASGNVTGYAPRYTQTTTLNPDQQNLLNLETQAKTNLGNTAVSETSQLQNALNKPVDPSQWTPWQTSLPQQTLRQDQGTTDRAGIEKAMMDSYNRSVAPTEQAQESQPCRARVVAGKPGLRPDAGDPRRQPRRASATGLPRLRQREPRGAGRLQRRRHPTFQHEPVGQLVPEQSARRADAGGLSEPAPSRSTKSPR